MGDRWVWYGSVWIIATDEQAEWSERMKEADVTLKDFVDASNAVHAIRAVDISKFPSAVQPYRICMSQLEHMSYVIQKATGRTYDQLCDLHDLKKPFDLKVCMTAIDMAIGRRAKERVKKERNLALSECILELLNQMV